MSVVNRIISSLENERRIALHQGQVNLPREIMKKEDPR